MVRIILTNQKFSLNVPAICESGTLISFVDNSLLSILQLQGLRASLSGAGIHCSHDIKTGIVPIPVSANEKS